MEGHRSPFVTPAEVAETLAMARSTVYDCIARGDIPSITVGRSKRIPRAWLDRMLADGTQRAITALLS
jgi:excisionase family DNA binding protein